MTDIAIKRKSYDLGTMIPFLALHAAVLLAFTVPFSLPLVAWALGSYYLRMFAVTAGYHRYFSHRSYKLNRVSQFLMGFLAETSAQKGVLWWAAHHRHHHRYSDQEPDLHSPWWSTLYHAHVGWILSSEHDEYDPRLIADFYKFPELRWLDKYYWIPTVVYAVAIYLIGGWPALMW